MNEIKSTPTLIALFFCVFVSAQLKTIKGEIVANDEVEGIHILNKSALKYTVTDTDGSFEILVKAMDTLTISGLKYQLKDVLITEEIINLGHIQIRLEEKVNQLDQVVVGRILTGSLGSDLKNTELKKEINFYDLGIPGYTGKPKTLNERKLAEATSGGGFIPLFPLINAITGRTKRLKKQIELDKKDKCITKLKAAYSDLIFKNEKLSESQILQYFYYCSDDANFTSLCKGKSELTQVAFLIKKREEFKLRIDTSIEKD